MQTHRGLKCGRAMVLWFLAGAWITLPSVSHSQSAQINRAAALCQKQIDLRTAALDRCMNEYRSSVESDARDLLKEKVAKICREIIGPMPPVTWEGLVLSKPQGWAIPPGEFNSTEEYLQYKELTLEELWATYWEDLRSCQRNNFEPSPDEYRTASLAPKNKDLLETCWKMAEQDAFPRSYDASPADYIEPIGRHCVAISGQIPECILERKFKALCAACPTCNCTSSDFSSAWLNRVCRPWAIDKANVITAPDPSSKQQIVSRNVACGFVAENYESCKWKCDWFTGWDQECLAACRARADQELAACLPGGGGIVKQRFKSRPSSSASSLRDTRQQKTSSSKTATAGAPQRKNNLDRFELGPTFVSPDTSSSGSRTARSGSAAKSGSGNTKLTPTSPSDTVTTTTTTTQPVGGASATAPKYTPR